MNKPYFIGETCTSIDVDVISFRCYAPVPKEEYNNTLSNFLELNKNYITKVEETCEFVTGEMCTIIWLKGLWNRPNILY